VRWEADYAMTAAAPEHARNVMKHVKHARQTVSVLDACEQDADRFREVKTTMRRWAATAENVRTGYLKAKSADSVHAFQYVCVVIGFRCGGVASAPEGILTCLKIAIDLPINRCDAK
jgi:hypothetical protein